MRASEFIIEGNDEEFHTGGALGLPFPGSYEQEYNMFKRKGSRRITAMTNEALDSSYDYEGNAIGGRYFFETEDGVEYKVYFSGNNLVEVAFNASTDGGDTWKTTMIGTGNANKVFGTVIKIIQEYVAIHQPKALYFTADKDERGRVSLYKRLASQVDRALPNYIDAGPNDLGSGVAFMVKRKGDKINFSGEDDVTEAEKDTPESKEIVATLKKAGYKNLGSGADATVWMKDVGQIIKIVMPESEDITQAAFTFKKFYEFCMQHQDLACLPKFIPIQGEAYAEFTIGNKDYVQISMEQLYPLKRNSFDEGIVWFFSDYVSNGTKWEKVDEELKWPSTWYSHNSKFANRYTDAWENLNPNKKAEYQLLYVVMQLLYRTGKINKMFWDLHTANAMQRKDGTIVIIDPWFERYSGSISENLVEIADSPYDYIQNVKTPAKRAYRFQTDNGQLYRVQVLNRETPDIKNFGINKNLEIHFDLTDMKTGKPNTGRTNTGDSIRVFSTVANILQKEVAEQKPTGIVIASKADDEGRVRLYKTLARRATKLMPDYIEAGEQTVTGHDGNQYITIQLKRKDLVSEKWSNKYKRSINCNNPKGFSQRAHCQGRKK